MSASTDLDNTSELPFIPELDAKARYALQEEFSRRYGLPMEFRDPVEGDAIAPAMVVIPPGMFEMGSTHHEFGHRPDEGPQHYVQMRRPFAIGRYAVTADEFERFAEEVGYYWSSELIRNKGSHPVINIRWKEAVAYAKWLSDKTGETYRLPTEAEWEYAARAGSSGPFCFGESVSCKNVHFNATFPYKEAKEKRKWFLPRCFPTSSTVEVGSYPANDWGLHEVHGNVQEMTLNPWRDSHVKAMRDGSVDRSGKNPAIVVKGGSWFDPAVAARSAARRRRLKDELDTNLGFRLVRELAPL